MICQYNCNFYKSHYFFFSVHNLSEAYLLHFNVFKKKKIKFLIRQKQTTEDSQEYMCLPLRVLSYGSRK